MRSNKPKSEKELREFGLVMTTACVVFGGVFLWRGAELAPLILFVLGILFLVPAIFAPERLRTAEIWWMRFAARLSAVMTVVIVTLTFFLAVTPLAILLRLMRKDLLSLRIAPEAETYWVPVEEDGPGTRPFKPY